MNYLKIIDWLMEKYTSGEYQDYVYEARLEFKELAGDLDQDSPSFESKTAQFIDWYLFKRPLCKGGAIPINLESESSNTADYEDFGAQEISNLQNSRYSMFEFNKVKNNDVWIKDLFSGEKQVVGDSPVTVGFDRQELFEVRLIPHGDNFVFSNSFCFHPSPVTKFILKEIKKVKKVPEDQQKEAREQLLERLFRMRHKHEQYKHVDVKKVYSNESKLGL